MIDSQVLGFYNYGILNYLKRMVSTLIFEDLDCWKKSSKLVKYIYDLSSTGKFASDYGVIDAMRKAASSLNDIGLGLSIKKQKRSPLLLVHFRKFCSRSQEHDICFRRFKIYRT